MSTNNSNNIIRHRTLSSPSTTIIHDYNSQSLPTVPRVRDNSPNALTRVLQSSSIPDLEILTEEDEDIIPMNEQPNLISLTLHKQNSYQTNTKHQKLVLPTILESHDHETMMDNTTELKSQDSFVATNTNYNQNEQKFHTNKNNEMIELTINKLLQQKTQRKVREFKFVLPTCTCQLKQTCG
ncbi:unnamed protein product [Adineta steineri]|uniref:Uncharacterized protein n=1 Tax=Adineta steineri TaxID=433720 RepID=A0A814Q3L3_9BILA|nr:unnamed protein product [Adineta steineri]CAF1557372.1 unnamed protein product [Adineta steineri]CAF1558183.1 unnamed protein product [Adineta steineri]